MGCIIQNFNQKRQFLCNVTHTCIKFFTNTIQITKKRTLHTSIISESKEVLKGGNKNAFKSFFFLQEENESSIKAIFFDGSFF